MSRTSDHEQDIKSIFHSSPLSSPSKTYSHTDIENFGSQKTIQYSQFIDAVMRPRTTQPTSYGQRLLPRVLDETASSRPERLYASYPPSADIADGFRDETFKDMANAVDSFAHFLHKSIGQGVEFETLCFLGVPDLRTAIVCFASWKCGYKVVLAKTMQGGYVAKRYLGIRTVSS